MYGIHYKCSKVLSRNKIMNMSSLYLKYPHPPTTPYIKDVYRYTINKLCYVQYFPMKLGSEARLKSKFRYMHAITL